jgi:hypothetical protein
MNTWEVTIIAVGIALEIGLFVCLVLVTRRLGRFDQRLAHLTDALSLLTETAEAGFRANAAEIGRLGERAPGERDPSLDVTSRLARAVRRGRSVQQIAADEQISEGEVRLRLHLANRSASAPLSPARAT